MNANTVEIVIVKNKTQIKKIIKAKNYLNMEIMRKLLKKLRLSLKLKSKGNFIYLIFRIE